MSEGAGDVVLYVDDEPANLASFSFALEARFEIRTVGSGEEAVRALDSGADIAVLLTDQRMPGMTGVQLCERAREIRPDVVRVVLTAYADLPAAVDAINRGQVWRYLAKPWCHDELIATLQSAIDLRRGREIASGVERDLRVTERVAGTLLGAAVLDHELRKVLLALEMNGRAIDSFFRSPTESPGEDEVLRIIRDDRELVASGLALLDAAARGDVFQSEGPPRSDLRRSVEASLAHARARREGHANITVEVPEGIGVAVPARALTWVLTNLVANACQSFSASDPAQRLIAMRARVAGDRVILGVSDSGVGIAPDEIPHVFNLFRTTRAGCGGKGIGLWASRKMLARCGGTIEVESAVGHGTTFTICLPVGG